jgi:hypothetical protein
MLLVVEEALNCLTELFRQVEDIGEREASEKAGEVLRIGKSVSKAQAHDRTLQKNGIEFLDVMWVEVRLRYLL